jgi:hypothetical protein
VVNGSYGTEVGDEFAQERLPQQGLLAFDRRLLGKNDDLDEKLRNGSASAEKNQPKVAHLCRLWICGKQSPINIGPISEVWVFKNLRGSLQHRLHGILGLRGFLEEKFHDGGEKLELNLSRKNAS